MIIDRKVEVASTVQASYVCSMTYFPIDVSAGLQVVWLDVDYRVVAQAALVSAQTARGFQVHDLSFH